MCVRHGSIKFPFLEPPFVEGESDIYAEGVFLEHAFSLVFHPLCADIDERAVVP